MLKAFLWLPLFILYMILSGCVSLQSKPMNTGQLDSIRSGKTAVMFFDAYKRITYFEQTYQVLAVTQSKTHASYQGFWDINKDMSKFHAKYLRAEGVNAESAYKKTNKKEIEYLETKQKKMVDLFFSRSENSEPITETNTRPYLVDSSLRQTLINKGYEHLIWIPLEFYSLNIPTLGLSPRESINMGYMMYDLKNAKTTWKGRFHNVAVVELNGKKSKDFLEKNNLKGYKRQLKNLSQQLYKIGHIGKSLGFRKNN